ncbi:MAG: PQQ-binding-like beta-propeller repeat protein [Gemmataceae bacterium]
MCRLLLALVAFSLGAADWPRFLGPTGDNHSAETGLMPVWPKDGLKKLWAIPLGPGYAPPTIAGGQLFHFDRHEQKQRLSCRDAATGELKWTLDYASTYEDQYGYDAGPRACPVVDGDRVYVYGPDGVLLCANTAGKELWKRNLSADYRVQPNFFGVGSAPCVQDEVLIVAVGGSPPGPRPRDLRQVQPNGTAIVGLKKRTGETLYTTGNDLASYSTPIVTKAHGRLTAWYFARNQLLAFDPATGERRAEYAHRAKTEESVNAANPVIVGEQVFISECYGPGSVLFRFTGTELKPLWTDRDKDRDDRSLAAHWNTPIVHDGYLYGSSGRHANEGDLRCIEFATGTVQWIERRTTRSTLLKADGKLIALGEDGTLRLLKLNAAKYDELSRFESPDLNYPAWAPPVLSAGRLYVRGKDRLVCYQLRP